MFNAFSTVISGVVQLNEPPPAVVSYLNVSKSYLMCINVFNKKSKFLLQDDDETISAASEWEDPGRPMEVQYMLNMLIIGFHLIKHGNVCDCPITECDWCSGI